MLAVTAIPTTSNAAYVQLAEGVFQDDSALYILSSVTSLSNLQVNPSVIYCYATIPPACTFNTFTGYDASLHVPTSAIVSYFTAAYWFNFSNVFSDAVEPEWVSLSNTSVEIELGGQFTLSASVHPLDAAPGKVTWTTTNPAVATVNGGVVTAVGVGECYIRAICVDKQAVCHVTVTPVYVDISLDMHDARVLPNHVFPLIATCTPAAPTGLAVTSSNPGVAIPRVVNGSIQVLGVSEGTAIITATTADGYAYADSCFVTVYTQLGDVNCDGYVRISDVTCLINYLLNGEDPSFKLANADTNQDGKVSITDVTTLINYLLGGIDINPSVTETFTVNGVSFTMVAVEGGSFTMGATAEQGSDAIDNEQPIHQVTVSSFSIGQTEVTQALWLAVMGSNPSYFKSANGYDDDLNRPVENVSWSNCRTFITRLNNLTGRSFRLPTEAEWEYAARGGNKSQSYKYAGSNAVGECAWYSFNIPSQTEGEEGYGTQSVASKKANGLGLYDMSGNVWEWCQDRYGAYNSEAQTNPTGPASGSYRVHRGGSWSYDARSCRVSSRGYSGSSYTDKDLGLRIAL